MGTQIEAKLRFAAVAMAEVLPKLSLGYNCVPKCNLGTRIRLFYFLLKAES